MLAKFKNKVLEFDQDLEDKAVLVTLKYGWRFTQPDPCGSIHVQSFHSVFEALQAIKGAMHCACDQCYRTVIAAKKS